MTDRNESTSAERFEAGRADSAPPESLDQLHGENGGVYSKAAGNFDAILAMGPDRALPPGFPEPELVSTGGGDAVKMKDVLIAQKPLEGSVALTDQERRERYESEAKALVWDTWNEQFSRGIAKDVTLDRSHPDLTCPPEYRPLSGSRIQREVRYDVTIERDGHISKIELTKPSGSAYFDQQIKKALEHQDGRLAFPEESQLDRRVIQYRYGWNVNAAGVTYPKGQVEIDGKLSPGKQSTR